MASLCKVKMDEWLCRKCRAHLMNSVPQAKIAGRFTARLLKMARPLIGMAPE